MQKQLISVLAFLLSISAMASDPEPGCFSRGQVIPVNNAQVLQWEASTPNQFLARGHIIGRIERVYANQTGHEHFAVQIGSSPGQTIEVIYNIEFGSLPSLSVGMQVEACGDYITSTAQAGPYPPSPDRAILHWVHRNPSGHGHDSGFVMIDGILYGQGNGGRDVGSN